MDPLRRSGAALEEIAGLDDDSATKRMQEIYAEPVKEELIGQRIQEIKDSGVVVAASLTPQKVLRYYKLVLDAGVDIFVIQGTVVRRRARFLALGAPEPEAVHR